MDAHRWVTFRLRSRVGFRLAVLAASVVAPLAGLLLVVRGDASPTAKTLLLFADFGVLLGGLAIAFSSPGALMVDAGGVSLIRGPGGPPVPPAMRANRTGRLTFSYPWSSIDTVTFDDGVIRIYPRGHGAFTLCRLSDLAVATAADVTAALSRFTPTREPDL